MMTRCHVQHRPTSRSEPEPGLGFRGAMFVIVSCPAAWAVQGCAGLPDTQTGDCVMLMRVLAVECHSALMLHVFLVTLVALAVVLVGVWSASSRSWQSAATLGLTAIVGLCLVLVTRVEPQECLSPPEFCWEVLAPTVPPTTAPGAATPAEAQPPEPPGVTTPAEAQPPGPVGATVPAEAQPPQTPTQSGSGAESPEAQQRSEDEPTDGSRSGN